MPKNITRIYNEKQYNNDDANDDVYDCRKQARFFVVKLVYKLKGGLFQVKQTAF